MRIKSIDISNFLSYRSNHLDLIHSYDDPPAIYVIDGLNLDSDSDDASNGAGKSIILSESVFYNIYGRGLRGTKQRLKLNDMIRYGCEKMVNEVEYFINSDDGVSELKISRTKVSDGASTTAVTIDGDEKTKRTKRLSDKDIKLFIDMTPEVFSQVIMYYKDNITLLEMNYGQRLDFFKTIIDLSVIDDYYFAARDFKIENEKNIFELELKIKSTNDIINVLSKDANKYVEFVTNRISELEKELAELESTPLYDIEQIQEQKQLITDEINAITVKANEIQAKIVYENKCAAKIKDEAIKIQQLSGAQCPTCKQEVPPQYVDRLIDAYSKEINTIVDNVKKITADKAEIDKDIKVKNSQLNKINDKLNEYIASNRIKKNKISSLKIEIDKFKKDLLNNKTSTSNTPTENKELFEIKLKGLTNALNIRRDWQEDAEYWYNIFAPKSLLRSTVIKKYVALLSDTFEYYISSLYNNEIVGKILVNDDGQIDIVLFKDGFEANYWQLSSGEKKRISIALMLSLYEFTSSLNPNIPKFIVADEIFDSLDVLGRLAVMETLIDMQKRHGLDLFLISHVDIPIEAIPEDTIVKHILVTKKDKVSTAKIVDYTNDDV